MKYINKIKVLQVIEACEQGIEQDVFIEIAEKKLKCFWSLMGEEFLAGEIVDVQLSLLTLKREKIEDKEKHIHTEERWGTPNRCILMGQIRDIYEIDGRLGGYDSAVVDCGGIFVEVEVSPEDNFKIGDYIKAEGRLDIRKVEEVEKEKEKKEKEKEGED